MIQSVLQWVVLFTNGTRPDLVTFLGSQSVFAVCCRLFLAVCVKSQRRWQTMGQMCPVFTLHSQPDAQTFWPPPHRHCVAILLAQHSVFSTALKDSNLSQESVFSQFLLCVLLFQQSPSDTMTVSSFLCQVFCSISVNTACSHADENCWWFWNPRALSYHSHEDVGVIQMSFSGHGRWRTYRQCGLHQTLSSALLVLFD